MKKNGISWYLSFKNSEDCQQNIIKKNETKKLEDKNIKK